MQRWNAPYDLIEHVRALPERRLRAAVLGYHGYRTVPGAPRARVAAPQAQVTLLFGLGTHTVVLGRPGHTCATGAWHSLTAGPRTTALVVARDGGIRGIEAVLQPWAAYRIFGGLSMHRLANTVVHPAELLGDPFRTLVDALADTHDWTRRLALIDRALTDWYLRGPRCSEGVMLAWQRLHGSGGSVTVGQLAAETRWSARHLQARFREQIGLPPKAVAQGIRLHRALRMLTRGVPAAEAAQTVGYYDQAHLHREFRRMLGCTPAQFLGPYAGTPVPCTGRRAPAHLGPPVRARSRIRPIQPPASRGTL